MTPPTQGGPRRRSNRAAYEAEVAAGQREPDWAALGCFLTDAAAGMRAAPVTVSGGFAADPSLIRV
ncbi:hypothetical protein [Nocardia asiatica]|uniref:hypothetical protein n=1 Tax=Nocardia asiatica TaxID=209252 RepID=UPI0002D69F67|nr:hypothetical protein [Nocardia asiatica]